ncbi:MAG: diheme cytochrome c-553 [Saprospiraceae bacterium]|nr:diheme cytochrome c-553 [Saprospiraceae bacterium]
MKTIHLLALLLIESLSLNSCTEKEASPVAQADPALQKGAQVSPEEEVKRGEYLVHILGCNDCHSPKIMTEKGPAPDPKRLRSGHPADEQLAPIADKGILKGYALFNMSLTAAVGPWGTNYAANLTPDDTGIGSWTLEQFGKALREGKWKGMDGNRLLNPPMPWQNYVGMSDDDLSAIFAYLKSIPAVKNVVPAPVPPAG